MTPLSIALLSPSSWAAIGAPLGNHLWQSTVFVGAVWLLTLLLRKNLAQSRYVLWLIASAKFLIPFSLLIGLGSHLPWARTPAVTQPAVFLAMETVSEPFAPANSTPVVTLTAPSAFQLVVGLLPAFVLVVWSVGCLVVLLVWYLRWQRVNSARRAALPVQSGREFEALRRAEFAAPLPQQIHLLLSQSALEPGILGIFRPALLLPAGISEKLSDAQLDSVIAHELCHVRRRDNLAAALHMLVEALFWFHPLVWWMGARLVEERERACDEEVLRLGADPHLYAEGILKICKFYLESPQFCAAGVTGSNLKKRIEAIMTNRIARKLEWSKKLLLSSMGVAVVVGPIMFGLLHAPQGSAHAQAQNALGVTPAFETVSIKPNTTGEPMAAFKIKGRPMSATVFANDRFQATNVTLQQLIQRAYRLQPSQVSGGPYWLYSEKYDVDAKLSTSTVNELGKLAAGENNLGRRDLLQSLLADNFKLAFHRETRDVPGYALVVARDGPKLQQAKPADTYPSGLKDLHGHPIGGGVLVAPEGKLVGQGVPIDDLVQDLAVHYLGRAVVDQTGLSGKFDFTLQWTQEGDSGGASSAQSIDSLLKLLKALPEQLGLELRAQTVALEMLVIDRAENPASNDSSQTKNQTQSPEKSQAANMPTNPDASLTCVFAGLRYPEGMVIQEGNGPEQLCARVLVPDNDEDGQPLHAAEWIHTSAAIRERGKNVIHPPAAPPAICTPKPSTQSNLCSCEESGSWSEGADVYSTYGGKLNCKKGQWVPLPVDHPKQGAIGE